MAVRDVVNVHVLFLSLETVIMVSCVYIYLFKPCGCIVLYQCVKLCAIFLSLVAI